jgi:predicted MPP superfamily phosphohydrolase
MAQWTRPKNGETVIAHLSDLHFGSTNQEQCWATLRAFLQNDVGPALVLVTGDIVDSPDRKLYENARQELDDLNVPYYVCPGNHDRHFKGNVSRLLTWIRRREDTPAVFDQIFADRIVGPNTLVSQPVGTRWEIGLLGIDSSREADFFARGYINPRLFPRLEATTKAADPDLVILLTHHHLQSIRQLEEAHQKSFKSLSNLTLMVNSGSFLECLTRAHVDIVLHGHEHASHWAKYGSLEKGKGDLSVIGAGSATGNDAIGGCALERASFNAIIIAPDRSVTLNILGFEGGSWRVREEMPLFNATDARRLRLLRRAGKLNSDLNGQVTKHIEFTRERDALVRWVFKNWRLDSKLFEYVVYNSTGRPIGPLLRVSLPNGKNSEFRFEFKKYRDKDHTWYVSGDVEEEFVNALVNIEFSFKWLGGGLLTEEEMSKVTPGAPGLVRSEGYEFGYVFAGGPVAFAQLQLTLPPEFAPADVEVRVYDQAEQRYPDEERELRGRVLVLGKGRYSLVVTYPREKWWYVLAWRPVPRPAASETETRFRAKARKSGDTLLEEFQKSLPELFKKSARLSLYLLASNGSAERAAHLELPNTVAQLPPRISGARGDRSAMGQAFWGVPTASLKKPGEQWAQELGFSADEEALLLLPVRFSLGWTNPSPWAVVRIGITSAEVAKQLPSAESLDGALAPAVARLLTAALDVT